ncbi:hypothetical protein [Ketobacter sp.]|uniref:hypothetical protein n=1 Tax=Ketobacter sp. TaxID=2083498 RepID=UPI000F24D8CF|nr:hypothetical protein [Ketobacter sp.]RLT93009.1 MAG: hypothetical protein D9N14_19330 [Ketobacter sp.]
MSLKDRKHAFLNVLAANLDKGVRDEVMTFWEEKYSTRPQFGVSAFLDELYSKYSIPIKKGQLFRELSRATMSAAGASRPERASALEPDATEVIDKNGLVVYQALQDEFTALAKPADRMKITKAQFDGIQAQNQYDSTSIRNVMEWLRGGPKAMPNRAELGLLRKLFNLGYVESCHLYGPVKTDQMLNTALQKTNNIPEAHITPPVYFI